MNQLKLVASILEKSALRYTPAGIPIANAVLAHRSQQIQANALRDAEFEIVAIAAGDISKRFLELELGVTSEFTGFLVRKNRNSKSLVFHITNFEKID
ncbi:MAG: primosomal replication protein N [Burkholderiaceae bacterium]|nr:primosomal replication protein N [Burkholderiaceae bacterium]